MTIQDILVVDDSKTELFYLTDLLSKLHSRDRAQLVVIAYESGLAGST